MPGKDRRRLDRIVAEKGLAESREKAKALIMAGRVLVDDTPVTKAGVSVSVHARVRVRGGGSKYVSRGGEKLEGALDDFNIDPKGLDVLDIGASTGGFTDCLLRRGAKTVAAVDVGYGQLAMKLRNDKRVSVFEKTNARYLDPGDFDKSFDMATMDVSFISLLKVFPAVSKLLKDDGLIVSLVKPQFEAGRGKVGKGGVVKDAEVHTKVLKNITDVAVEFGLYTGGLTFSRLRGPKGNIEFFAVFFNNSGRSAKVDHDAVVDAAHSFFQNL